MIILTVIGYILLAIAVFIILFLLMIPIGSWITVNRKFKNISTGIDIYLSTNGMHIDFIVPTQNHLFDWSTITDSTPFAKSLRDYPFLGFGWGDPGFFLELEAWDKLTFKIASRALLIPTPTIMHIIGLEALPKVPEEKSKVEKVTINPSQYLGLCSFIYKAFDLDKKHKTKLIPDVGYTEHDNFYHAKGRYHAFHTCNYWVNKGLKKIGVRTALWSPLDRGIFYQLKKIASPQKRSSDPPSPTNKLSNTISNQ